MNIKIIKEKNGEQFLLDIKKVRGVLVFANNTLTYIKVAKKEVMKEAEDCKIIYHITDSIYKNKRDVMVVT